MARPDLSLTPAEQRAAVNRCIDVFAANGGSPSSIPQLVRVLRAEGQDNVTLTGLARLLESEPGFDARRDGSVRRV